MATVAPSTYFDFRKALGTKKLTGMLRMMTGYRMAYVASNLTLAFSALAKTTTYLLLRNFADTVVGDTQPFAGTFERTLILIALGFIVLALVEGGFAYLSSRLASNSPVACETSFSTTSSA
jgi:ABC-type multidrug transport system fused ATPase/permease subunit